MDQFLNIALVTIVLSAEIKFSGPVAGESKNFDSPEQPYTKFTVTQMKAIY